MTATVDASVYNSLYKLRGDAWGSLDTVAERLADAAARRARVAPLIDEAAGLFELLEPVEHYWAFPGVRRFEQARRLFAAGEHGRFAHFVGALNRELGSDAYRRAGGASTSDDDAALADVPAAEQPPTGPPYFEVLIVDQLTAQQEAMLRDELRRLRRPTDEFVYEIVVVPTFEDAVIAVMFNFNIQACVVHRRFSLRSRHDLSRFHHLFADPVADNLIDCPPEERAQLLGARLRGLRPELDLYLMSEVSIEKIAANLGTEFQRVFHSREGSLEVHVSLLDGVARRYRAPFFSALRDYSHRPTGVFHALPISRGKSIVNSHWIRDMEGFYGLEVFLAETSATSGGLDSLLDPTGPLREAQQLAAETFGSKRTYFATNGTSTANKIVVQALVRPGDIVLVDRNCHQSHHYGLVQAGAYVTYLDAYPLPEYSIYGAVPLKEIKRSLLALRRAGKLDQVRLLMLTNCTFDGIVYDVERVMEECLAIKPDLVFLWDEAWFAFARFHPVYRPRTAMAAASKLLERLRDPDYRGHHAAHASELERANLDDDELLERRLLPDPDRARVRVYATQSTHKTLTSLRQGSMIHVFDQDFTQQVEESFHEAYMCHTSTSPNYQILASLDIGRRQASLEGFELVQKQVELAMVLRDAIDDHPVLRHQMRTLSTKDLIPAEYRPAGLDRPLGSGLSDMTKAWELDEFVLDPCRITLFTGETGIDGDTFKRELLMDRYGVQINKTSRNSVLFMTNIGTTRSSVAYLIEVLVGIARELESKRSEMNVHERAELARRVNSLTNGGVPLPDFSAFHDAFRNPVAEHTPEGNMRGAFYLAYDDSLCEHVQHDELSARVNDGATVVSASFVAPYPPGCPILVPGQLVSPEVLAYIDGLDVKEIHGYQPDRGYRVFRDQALHAPQRLDSSEQLDTDAPAPPSP